ncbi:MAG TPA: enolase C-terminal domain-like protein [Oculatellaceae cyanobacterium]
MKIVSLEARVIKLPFRFSFKHSLASRNFSENLIVRAVLSDGSRNHVGYGESIPRDYVTGETVQAALARLEREFAPRFLQRQIDDPKSLLQIMQNEFADLKLISVPAGSAWCALELALLDAFGHATSQPLSAFFGGVKRCHPARGIRYGGVIPFGGKKAVTALLWFYKLFGFQTVKLKVGKTEDADLELVSIARRILGPDAILRVDANCAWTADQTMQMAEKMKPFAVASIEQPVPADDIEGLIRISQSIETPIMVDESLCTISQAKDLTAQKACKAFNVRISKVGGFLSAQAIVDIARSNGLIVQMGAQVGESGILSAAGRAFSSVNETFDNCEGSNNLFLLKQDVTLENLNVGLGGWGSVLKGNGLGVTVRSAHLPKFLMNVSEVDNRNLVGSNW